jgi:outer membrane biosynthesis protein TonB
VIAPRTVAGRLATASVLGLLLASATGCRKRPADASPAATLRGRVSLEAASAVEAEPADWLTRIVPPRYSEALLPEYPPEALADRVPGATVRVTFVVGVDGRAYDVKASLVEDVPHAEAFATACEAVLRKWAFSPAWRLARETDATDAPVVLVASDSVLRFRFDLTAHLGGGGVEVSFEPTR